MQFRPDQDLRRVFYRVFQFRCLEREYSRIFSGGEPRFHRKPEFMLLPGCQFVRFQRRERKSGNHSGKFQIGKIPFHRLDRHFQKRVFFIADKRFPAGQFQVRLRRRKQNGQTNPHSRIKDFHAANSPII